MFWQKHKVLLFLIPVVFSVVFLLIWSSAKKTNPSENKEVQNQESNSDTIKKQPVSVINDQIIGQESSEASPLSEELIKKQMIGAGKKDVWYGRLRHFSSSGSMKFYYADSVKREKLKNGDSPWFWASVSGSQIQYIGSSEDAIFKMTGTGLGQDCGYLGDGDCLEEIQVEKIEIVK